MSTTASQSRDLADAAYKWVPAFREQTLQSQFAHHLGTVSTPVIHQWIDLWYHVAVYIALFLGAAGSAWSVDAWVRGRGGKVSLLRG